VAVCVSEPNFLAVNGTPIMDNLGGRRKKNIRCGDLSFVLKSAIGLEDYNGESTLESNLQATLYHCFSTDANV